MPARGQRGFSLIETLVSLAVLLLLLTALASLMVQNGKMNRSEQMTAQVQASARNCLTMIVQPLRGAGWDPVNAGIGTVVLDSDPADDVAEIEVLADLDEDGATDGVGEQVLIRHVDDRVVWRLSNDVNQPFVVLASGITNDADGDGTIEPMFVPDSLITPSRITVRITARSPAPDPVTGEFIRYTVASDVTLRKTL